MHPKIHSLTSGSNLHIIDGGADGLILIDAGFIGAKGALLNHLQKQGKTAADINHIIVTHADPDHVGSLHAIKTATQAAVYADDRTKFYIESPKMPPHVPWYLLPILWPVARLVKTSTVDVELVPDTTIEIAGGLMPVDTPGHTPDHMAIWWEAERVVFVGDVIFNVGRKPFLSPAFLSWSAEAVKNSARKLLDLNPRYIYFGHGPALDLEGDTEKAAALKRLIAD